MTDFLSPALDRLEQLVAAYNLLNSARSHANSAAMLLGKAWEGWSGSYADKLKPTAGLSFVTGSVMNEIHEDIHNTVGQIARLTARDVIAPVARESENPVVWLTGNSMMPPIRELTSGHIIWELDATNSDLCLFSSFMETLDNCLVDERVYMAAPDYDNALYVVDLTRWQHRDNEMDETGNVTFEADSLDAEWEPIPNVHAS